MTVNPKVYLQPDEYAAYGLSSGSATDTLVQRASQVINTYCGRAKYGFVYLTDAAGNPATMAGAVADIQITSTAAISPGQNVVVNVKSGFINPDLIGMTLTLDPNDDALREVCVITGCTGGQGAPNTITLGIVVNSHTGPNVTMVGGLQINERRYLDNRRAYVRVAQWPIINIIAGAGRIEYGRRNDQITGAYYDNSILAVFATANWGGAPPWLIFDPTQMGVNNITGQLWIPVSVYLMRYSEVKVSYIAGYTYANLPPEIKQACASLVINKAQLLNTPMMDPNFKKATAGDTSLERFSTKGVIVDSETAALLDPYMANQLY